MKNAYITLLPVAILAASPLSAQDKKFDDGLLKAASKVDTDGSYLQLNRLDGDIKVITEYLSMALDIAKQVEDDVPKDLDVKELVQILGLHTLKSTAQSAKFDGNVWTNKAFIDNGGSNKGIFSLLGGNGTAYSVADMAPEGADLALQLKLDLRQVEKIIMEIAGAVGEERQAKRTMNEQIPNLDLAVGKLLSKFNVTMNLVVDLNPDKRVEVGPMEIAKPNIVGRIDGLAWMWDQVGEKMMKEMHEQIPFVRTEKMGVITYTVPEEMKKDMEGFSPILVVDKPKNQIWISAREEFLTHCQTTDKKLSQSAPFKATWAGMPAKGNSMAYVSKELLDELVLQYDKYAKAGAFGEEFEPAKPLVDKLVADLTQSKVGFALAISKDADGVQFVAKTPLPMKGGAAGVLGSLAPYWLMAQDSVMEAPMKEARPMRRLETKEAADFTKPVSQKR